MTSNKIREKLSIRDHVQTPKDVNIRMPPNVHLLNHQDKRVEFEWPARVDYVLLTGPNTWCNSWLFTMTNVDGRFRVWLAKDDISANRATIWGSSVSKVNQPDTGKRVLIVMCLIFTPLLPMMHFMSTSPYLLAKWVENPQKISKSLAVRTLEELDFNKSFLIWTRTTNSGHTKHLQNKFVNDGPQN